MGRFSNSRPRVPSRSYPTVSIPKAGIYHMVLASIGKPFDDDNRCRECNGKMKLSDGSYCQKCDGTGRKTTEKIRIRYEMPNSEFYAEEDVTNKISQEWKNNAGETISASTLLKRLTVFTGFDDPDLLSDMTDEQIDDLNGTPCEVVVMLNKTQKYLRIHEVGVVGFMTGGNTPPIQQASPPRASSPPAGSGHPPVTQTGRIEAPTLASIKEAYLATGRGENEWPAFLQVQLGGAKTVTPDQKLRLMKTVEKLPLVGGQYIDSIAGEIENLDFEDDNEEVPF
jgi:hypothetical protein